MPIVEIIVRTFFTGEEGDVIPSATIAINDTDIPKIDWGHVLQELTANLTRDAHTLPFKVRPMTKEETILKAHAGVNMDMVEGSDATKH